MNWIVYVFGSGAAFFGGVGVLLIGVAGAYLRPQTAHSRVETLLAVTGLLLIALSATPLPLWFYAGAMGASLVWLVAERTAIQTLQKQRKWWRLSVAVLWSVAALTELPYHQVPRLEAEGQSRLYIFGDSVAAGMGQSGVETWPRLLADSHPIDLHDYSHPGGTVGSALRIAETMTLQEGIVLLEIGGNDLLGPTPASEFERDLDRLLSHVCGPGRTVLMLELPLPPLSNGFGRAQRRLTAKHAVLLVPKRIFIGVLTTDQATVDSIHLSPEGHRVMAETVWGLLEPAYAD